MMPSATNSISLLKKVNSGPESSWMKEYVTDSGILLLNETRKGNVERVVDLLCKGASFSSDSTGVSPLHFAAYNNSTEITELLLNSGMMRDSKNKLDRTPLHTAAQMGHTEVLKILLTYGADPDITDLMLMTALHWAVEGGHVDCVRVLLQYGARTNLTDVFGRTPCDISLENPNIFHLLKNKTSVLNIVADSAGDTKLNVKKVAEKRRVPPDENVESAKRFKEESTETKESTSNEPTVAPSIRCEMATMEMLKKHGIQMLEPDKATTVRSAVESGQKVVLTEAGKLALGSLGQTEPVISFSPSNASNVNGSVIIRNGKKMIKINTKQLISFSLEKNKAFFKNVSPVPSIRLFEGKLYSEDEDELLMHKLKLAIDKVRNEAKLLDIFAKRKFRQANLYQEQLLSLQHQLGKGKQI